MRIYFIISIIGAQCFCLIDSYAQITEFTFTGSAGNEISFPADNQPINGQLTDISRGSGINPTSSAGKFSANNWSTSDFDPDDYYTFAINSNEGYLLTLTKIELTERRSSTGIRDWSIRSSIDGFTADIITFNVPDDDLDRDQTINLPIDFNKLASSVTVEFRIYAFNAESSTGSWRLDNIKLFGNISTPDLDPPVINQISVLSSNSILIEFSEPVDQNSAESVINYSLNNTEMPISAVLQPSISEVIVFFLNEFDDGFDNVLAVSGIEDLSENIMLLQSMEFAFILISPASYRDIVINEILADPTPQIGLPNAEFIEIYNLSTKKIDLKGYTLNDDLITQESHILFPYQYVILTDAGNAGLFTGSVIGLNTMGAITNSGESIVLKDVINDSMIDSLSFSIEWYIDSNKDDGGYSLELINPETDCTGQVNWAVSNDPTGGTPGFQNSIYSTTPDAVPPNLVDIEIQSPDTLILIFDEAIDGASLINGNYSIDHGFTILSVLTEASDLSFVSLILNTPLESGNYYKVTAIGLTDCIGNPIATNSITFYYDIMPPEVVKIEPIYYNEIVVIFNEPLDETSAKVKANYSIDNGLGSPSSVTVESDNRVHIYFNSGNLFSQNSSYQISILNIEDTLENSITTPQFFNFEFVAPLVPYPGDIFINEIMADPSPTIGLPDSEYIEIWNASDTTFNLNQLMLADLSGVILLPSYSFSKNEFLILTSPAASEQFESFGKVLAVPDFPSLNNSLETVSLLLRDSSVINSITYSSEWYGDLAKEDGGYSLELINPFAPCDGQNNWRASENSLGGTPGTINSVYSELPDSVPPHIKDVIIVDELHIEIVFDERMDEFILSNLDNYEINEDLTFDMVVPGNSSFTSVNLTLGTPLISGHSYEITVKNLADCSGNQLIQSDFHFYFDNTPPQIVEINAIYYNELLIIFDEPIDRTSAKEKANYFIEPELASPSSVIVERDYEARLFFDSGNFHQNTIYQISVINIQDTLGNKITSPLLFNFEFIPALTPQPGDIFINEIMADPSPTIGLPEAEYIEIWNASDTTFNLNQLMLVDLSAFILLPSYSISKDEYLILTSAAASEQFEPFGKVLPVPDFPSLNNSLETVSLLLRDSSVINSITYTTEWYGDLGKEDGGYSLEKIGPDTNCGAFYSWKASKDFSGGTPGRINSVIGGELEIEPIVITDFQINGAKSLQIHFSVDLSLEQVDNAIFSSNQLAIDHIKLTESRVLEVHFTDAIENGKIYSIEIDNLENCDESIANDLKVEFGEGAIPSYNDLLVTEIMANPGESTELPYSEYIEIFNASNKTISLKDLKLTDQSSFSVLPATLISPKEYIILTSNANVSEFIQFGNTIGLSNWPSLNNGEDVISLVWDDDYIFSVNYKDSWYKDSDKATGGWSLEMIDTNNPCGRIKNWMSSENPSGGTPGKANSMAVTNPDNLGPEILNTAIDHDKISIDFNEKINPNSIDLIDLKFVPDLSYEAPILNRPFDDQITVYTNQVLPKTTYQLTITNLVDCVGNIISSTNNTSTFNLPETAKALDIVINEVLFNPRTGGVDFVEAFNRSDKYINLKNWIVGNFDDSGVLNPKIISIDNLILDPGEFIVLTENPRILKADYPSGDERTFHETDLPSLPNDMGSIAFLNPDSVVIDRFEYSEDFHLQLLKDFDGVSLERISINAPTQNSDNWKSTASTAGFATPGLKNSQSLSIIENKGTIEVEPRVFSPDNNGFDDYATISYQFDVGNNIANVTVFDQVGRLVKKLLDNASLSTSGFITWDGTNESFQKVRIGYYIIHFEIYDSSGMTNQFKERVVVGGKL
ncbi:MAG: lamin tail domain-containing protein [Bacteroidetes bacterium]|nr:lamin tail domain-containing protein [Bacteroidota bacterium]